MKCETCFEWMSSYIDKELKEKELLAFEDHLDNCTSCQEELRILREIVEDINDLQEIELPDGFHQHLMSKIRLGEKPEQEKIIQIPRRHKKWYSNWRVVSSIAAAFVFSVLIFETLNINSPQEALPETASIQTRMPNIEEAKPKIAMDALQEGPRLATWEIHTKEYKRCKENIIKISEEMGLEKTITEDTILDGVGSRQLVIEVILDKNTKNLLVSKVREVFNEDEIEFYGDDEKQEKQLGDSPETLVITITEVK